MTLPLTPGDAGPEVVDLRRRLAAWQTMVGEDAVLAPDGSFDADVAGVLRRFQRARHLLADGLVGPETWAGLVEATWHLGDRLLWHASTTMRGDDVQEVQQRLNQLGFDAGPEDGLFGPMTRAAVEEFQADAGLEVDGVVGARTVAALRRLHRGHHAVGVSSRVREEHDLRRLARGGMTGLAVLVDPASLPAPGRGLPRPIPAMHARAATIPWELATRLVGALAAQGAHPTLTRGPGTHPSAAERARLANRLDVDLVLRMSLNRSDDPAASGTAAYHYGSLRFVSTAGRALATSLLDASLVAGLGPDCRVHPMTWAVLRETRMPAAVLEPGFATSAADVERLSDPAVQDRLVGALVDALKVLLARYGGP